MSNEWIPIADAEIDEEKRYECTFENGIVAVRQGDVVKVCNAIAVREYNPTPYVAPTPIDPGEGWRLLAENEPKQYGDECKTPTCDWHAVYMGTEKSKDYAYRRRIEPAYRPFASAAEYKPHRERWLTEVSGFSTFRLVHYGDTTNWRDLFVRYVFEDTGRPFGVEVTK